VVSRAFSALCACYAQIRRSGIILAPYATLVPNFVSVAPSIAELAHGEKSHTQSLTHTPSLFDSPGTEVFASKNSEILEI